MKMLISHYKEPQSRILIHSPISEYFSDNLCSELHENELTLMNSVNLFHAILKGLLDHHSVMFHKLCEMCSRIAYHL